MIACLDWLCLNCWCGQSRAYEQDDSSPDCIAQQTSEHGALTNIAAVFGPHLTPQSAAELAEWMANQKGNHP
jgi:hypothetical protein